MTAVRGPSVSALPLTPARGSKISVVIPAYRSEGVIARTLDRLVAELDRAGHEFEIVVVNDGSPDNVWDVIRACAAREPRIKAISLIKNYGQHAANFVGFRFVTGDCVVTMDDDLQNPPEEIAKLVDKWREGYDFVVGRFERKQHSGMRRLGTAMMHLINKRIFNGPEGFEHTNFRLIDRSVVDRMNAFKGRYPYTSGLAMIFCNRPVNVTVQHAPRLSGSSNYNLRRLTDLAWSIVFNYSKLPIKVLMTVGFSLSLASGLYALYLVLKALLIGSAVPGWTSLGVLIAFFNAILLLMLSLIAEYQMVILDQLRSEEHYHVKDAVGFND